MGALVSTGACADVDTVEAREMQQLAERRSSRCACRQSMPKEDVEVGSSSQVHIRQSWGVWSRQSK